MYERPVLCRLCRRPVADTGVRMSELDVWKLAKWWPKLLKTEFDEERLEEHFVCQFCLWDAKYERHQEGGIDCDWWTGHDSNRLYQNYYYEEEKIQPCEVKIIGLKSPSEKSMHSHRHHCNRGVTKLKCTPSKCIFCGEEFATTTKTMQHVRAFHKDIKKFHCDSCRVCFKTKEGKNHHLNEIHNGGFKCMYCPNKCASKSVLLKHIKNIHPDSKLKCRICSQLFKDVAEKKAHLVTKHLKLKLTHCLYCKMPVATNLLSQHVLSHHADVAVKCPYNRCGTYFFNDLERQRHVREEHELKNPKRQKCLFCDFYVDPRLFLQHFRKYHDTEKFFKCNYHLRCSRYFCTEADRRKHVAVDHRAEKTYGCIYCGRTFFSLYLFKYHMRKMHKKVRIKCQFTRCLKYFMTLADMQNHYQKKHGNPKLGKFKRCDHCPFLTQFRTRIINHITCRHI